MPDGLPDRPKKPRLPNRICRPGDPPCCASRQTGRRTFASLPAYPFGSPPAEQENRAFSEILFSEKPCCFFFHISVIPPFQLLQHGAAALPGFLRSDRRVRYQIRSCSRSGLPVPDGKPPWRSHEDRRGKAGLESSFRLYSITLPYSSSQPVFPLRIQSRREECRCDPFHFLCTDKVHRGVIVGKIIHSLDFFFDTLFIRAFSSTTKHSLVCFCLVVSRILSRPDTIQRFLHRDGILSGIGHTFNSADSIGMPLADALPRRYNPFLRKMALAYNGSEKTFPDPSRRMIPTFRFFASASTAKCSGVFLVSNCLSHGNALQIRGLYG